MPTVSFIIIAYNASKYLDNLLSDVQNQTYSHKNMQLILVDSNSCDDTKNIMSDFIKRSDFPQPLLLDNPKKTLPCGWNVALKAALGDIIIRVDAHARIPEDFVECSVRNIESGEKIVGGQRISVYDNNNIRGRMLMHAEQSSFGSGVGTYRRKHERCYVSTLAHAAYSSEVFEKVGMYDERLRRTEDNDMHYRMKRAGYKLCLCPDIVSYHHIRPSLKSMLKQKFLNGYWIGITTWIQPLCFSLYSYVPFGFVGAILALSVLSMLIVNPLPLISLLALYLLCAIIFTAKEIKSEKDALTKVCLVILPVLFFLLHICYGVGTVIGLSARPFKRFEKQVN